MDFVVNGCEDSFESVTIKLKDGKECVLTDFEQVNMSSNIFNGAITLMLVTKPVIGTMKIKL